MDDTNNKKKKTHYNSFSISNSLIKKTILNKKILN